MTDYVEMFGRVFARITMMLLLLAMVGIVVYVVSSIVADCLEMRRGRRKVRGCSKRQGRPPALPEVGDPPPMPPVKPPRETHHFPAGMNYSTCAKMSRARRFKAWDEQNKCWRRAFWVGSFNGLPYSIHSASETRQERWPVVEDTGKKDINGVRIWEDSIVLLDGTVPCRYRIQYVDGVFCLGGYPAENLYYWRDAIESGQLVVVGDIYQNPQLDFHGKT